MTLPESFTDLPDLLRTDEVAALMRKHHATVQRMCRDGEIPALKLPGGHWRVRLRDLEALLAGGQQQSPTPAQQRAELLGQDTITFLQELAANAPPLTEDQKDAIRAAFQGQT